MNTWERFTGLFGTKRDMLGFTAAATPSAEEWLDAFTTDFMRHPTTEHGAQALMSGVRFYTPAFVAQLAALSPVTAHQPAITGTIPRAIYTATGPLISGVYENLISRHAGQAEMQTAFTTAAAQLVKEYQQDSYSTNGVKY
jgi:hypothetical protein